MSRELLHKPTTREGRVAKGYGLKYRPSNGSEGDMFMDRWCSDCKRDHLTCEIIAAANCFDTADDNYPPEWTYREDGQPCCTAHEESQPDVVMVGGVHFAPTNAVRMSPQESERATALARDLVIKYLPPDDESGSDREECLEVAAGRMMKKLLREVPLGRAGEESYEVVAWEDIHKALVRHAKTYETYRTTYGTQALERASVALTEAQQFFRDLAAHPTEGHDHE